MELLKKFIQWSALGIGMGIGFVIPVLWPVGLIAIALFFSFLLNTTALKTLVVGSVYIWLLKYLLALIWYWSVYPIDWVPIDPGAAQITVIFLYWFTSAVWLALGGGVLAAVFYLIKKPVHNQIVLFLTFPFLWVLSEVSGSYIFSIFTNGTGGFVNIHFSFGYTGYLLAEHAILIHLSTFFGVYGLSFLFVALSVGFLACFQSHYNKYFLPSLGLLILIVTAHIPASRSQKTYSEYVTVSIIDTQLSAQELSNETERTLITNEIHEAVFAVLETESDYIVLPEDSRVFTDFINNDSVLSYIQFRNQTTETTIIDSGPTITPAGNIVSAYVIDPENNQYTTVQKKYLVPQGEYIPTLYKQALSLFLASTTLQEITNGINYISGSETIQKEISGQAPGILFCFESVSPLSVRNLLAERPTIPFVVHPISHSWFREPKILWQQLDSMLRIQAIWNDVHIVVAGRNAPGKLILPNGEIITPNYTREGNRWKSAEFYIGVK